MMLLRSIVKNKVFKQFFPATLSLFTSLSTLICCALPALLVTLGMGASLISLVSVFPWIIVISKYKEEVFFIAGFMLFFSSYFFWQGRNAPCPSDPIQAKICSKIRFFNLFILINSLIIYMTGFFFAFIAVRIF